MTDYLDFKKQLCERVGRVGPGSIEGIEISMGLHEPEGPGPFLFVYKDKVLVASIEVRDARMMKEYVARDVPGGSDLYPGVGVDAA